MRGRWWLPNAPNRIVPGVFHPRGQSLVLEAPLVPAPTPPPGTVVSGTPTAVQHPIILGNVPDAGPLTLVQATGVTLPIPEVPAVGVTESWNVTIALVGAHLPNRRVPPLRESVLLDRLPLGLGDS